MAIEFDIETKIETGLINQLLLNANIISDSIPVRRWEDLTANKVRPVIAVTVANIEQEPALKGVFIASPAICTIAIFTEYTRTSGDLDGKQLSTIKGYVREAISCETIIDDINDDIDGLIIYDEGFIIGSTDNFEAEPRKRQSNIQLMIYATCVDVGVSASGGTEVDYTVGDITYRAHIFTTDGTFIVAASGEVEYLVVGGGGGGGGKYEGGGGGAGGFIESSGIVSIQAYAITVGDGGAGAVSPSTDATNGDLSEIAGIASVVGGGYGGSNGISPNTGNDGASGGGAGLGAGGLGLQGNMHDGGDGDNSFVGAGGGGANQDGGDADTTPKIAGNGGDGLQNSYATGIAQWYSGGGGGGARGGAHTPGTGGQGGGADGENNTDGINAVANTGGGGGGAGRNTGLANGGDGGSGIIIIRYPI